MENRHICTLKLGVLTGGSDNLALRNEVRDPVWAGPIGLLTGQQVGSIDFAPFKARGLAHEPFIERVWRAFKK